MSDFLKVLLNAYMVGVSCSAGIVSFLKIMPIPDYAKKMMYFVLPIPPTCIALVMMYYGPPMTEQVVAGTEAHRAMVEVFFVGLSAGPLAVVVLILIQLIKKRLRQRNIPIIEQI